MTIKRALLALCLIFLWSCSTPTCRQWEIQEIVTKRPCFNGGRLLLEPDSNLSTMELELVRNRSGVRFYINLLLLQAPSCKEDSTCARVEVLFENQEPWLIYPYLLEGGQRLLIPDEVAKQLIQALSDQCSFTLKIGRSQIRVIPDNFLPAYEKLMAIPVES